MPIMAMRGQAMFMLSTTYGTITLKKNVEPQMTFDKSYLLEKSNAVIHEDAQVLMLEI